MPTLRLVSSTDIEVLLSLLREAEEGDARIVQAIEENATTAYLALDGDTQVGAAVMRWAQDESEIVYIATASHLRGQGYGKALVASLADKARQRGVVAVVVGTANSSPGNIVFYQKCGFRMDSVRKDCFDYLPAPIYENGVRMRDMLMLRLAVADTTTNVVPTEPDDEVYES